uniref:TBC1 domain family member 2A-like isoform X2 n=1 Tax=Petromyzon marinus TaxID=7757 RepID=A0AAJ7U685_PETMA|nr:TBC1 domain family member 2A-like isoform X2 [Petromyzon marinus]
MWEEWCEDVRGSMPKRRCSDASSSGDDAGRGSDTTRGARRDECGNSLARLPVQLRPPGQQQQQPLPPSREDCQPRQPTGYLYKLGKGRLRGFQLRWFSYEEATGELVYSRGPGGEPLGAIPLAGVSLIPAVQDEKTFSVRTPWREYTLKATSSKEMMSWLNWLKEKRDEIPSDIASKSLQGPASDSVTTLDSQPFIEEPSEEPETAETITALPADNAESLVRPEIHRMRQCSDDEQTVSIPDIFLPAANENQEEPVVDVTNSNVTKTTSESDVGYAALDVADKRTDNKAPVGNKNPSRWTTIKKVVSPVPLATHRPQDIQVSVPEGLRPAFTKLRLGKDSDTHSTISDLQMRVVFQEQELKAQQELVRLLHHTLQQAQQEKRASLAFQVASTEIERLEILRHRERQITDLSNRLQISQQQNEKLEMNVSSLQKKVSSFNEQMGAFTEMVRAKNEVILNLSSRLTEMEGSQKTASESSPPPSSTSTTTTITIVDAASGEARRNIERLKGEIETCKSIIKFLVEEVAAQEKLRMSTTNQFILMQEKYMGLNGLYAQLESKLLVLLHLLQSPSNSGGVGDEQFLAMLKADVLNARLKIQDEPMSPSIKKNVDIYGFKLEQEGNDPMTILERAQLLQEMSAEVVSSTATNRVVLDRWETFLSGHDLCVSPELKQLVRGGVPHTLRPRVWAWCAGRRVSEERRHQPPGYYHALVSQAQNERTNPDARHIELDLARTLPNNCHFEALSPKVVELRNVLLAFAWRNPHIGYCQGLNRLTAILLLCLEEEEAFWCLVALIEFIMPADYYSKKLIASQADQRVLRELVAEKLPRMHEHLESLGVDLTLASINWFLVLFVDSLQSDVLFRVWDAVLFEGSKVIFRYALAILKFKEEEVLQLQDYTSAFKYLCYFPRNIYDFKKLSHLAFQEMNPLRKRHIDNRRAVHIERLREELGELLRVQGETVRFHNSYVPSRPAAVSPSTDDEKPT